MSSSAVITRVGGNSLRSSSSPGEASRSLRQDRPDDREDLVAATANNEDGFAANLHVVDDDTYAEASPEQLLTLADDDTLFFIADRTAITAPEPHLLAASSSDGETVRIRVIPAGIWAIENNISIGDMGWEDFEDDADEDGVFRGFS